MAAEGQTISVSPGIAYYYYYYYYSMLTKIKPLFVTENKENIEKHRKKIFSMLNSCRHAKYV